MNHVVIKKGNDYLYRVQYGEEFLDVAWQAEKRINGIRGWRIVNQTAFYANIEDALLKAIRQLTNNTWLQEG